MNGNAEDTVTIPAPTRGWVVLVRQGNLSRVAVVVATGILTSDRIRVAVLPGEKDEEMCVVDDLHHSFDGDGWRYPPCSNATVEVPR